MPDNPRLVAAIRSALEACGGRITFARFMDLALYHPEHGYYRSGLPHLGKQGDYFTSVSVGPLFGQILAHRFRQFREQLGQPGEFAVVEFGGQRGQLRADVLAAAPELAYHVVEVGEPVPERITGCVFSNEFLDALPVHRVQVVQGKWREIYVTEVRSDSFSSSSSSSNRELGKTTEDEGRGRARPEAPVRFTESLGPLSDPRLATALAGLPVELMEGYRTEINLRALDWLTDVARRLERGFVLTIDYGFPREQYFAPDHPAGHLQCYRRHARQADPYQDIGDQDLTAHVEFSALMDCGERCGLTTEQFTDQAHYLLEAGEPIMREIVERTAGQLSPERQAIQQLIHPGLMGRVFRVLQQRKVVRD